MRLLIIAAALLALSACATTTNDQYRDYLAARTAEAHARSAALTAIAQTATTCTEDSCKVGIAGIAGMAAMTINGGSGSGNGPAAPPQPQPSTAAKIGLALVGQISPLAAAAVNWHQSDNSTEVQVAQYSFLEGVIANAGNALEGLAPSITVGGDYVTGGQIGDTIGDGSAVDGSQVGDNVGRDQSGGDHIDHSGDVGGDWRDASPGPIDQSNPGDGDGDCEGDCSGGDGGGA